MTDFTITETAGGEFILRVHGQYISRCSSYDEAVRTYEDYLLYF